MDNNIQQNLKVRNATSTQMHKVNLSLTFDTIGNRKRCCLPLLWVVQQKALKGRQCQQLKLANNIAHLNNTHTKHNFGSFHLI